MSRSPVDLQNRDRRWLKDGRGQGRRELYKRWLNIQDLTKAGKGQRRQQGTLVRPQGRVVQREYHLASHLESKVFDLFDNLDVTPWNIEVLDILEQFPLLSTQGADVEPAGDTIAIARELGVPHIPANHSDSPTVMTTDLVVKIRTSNRQQPIVLALAIKPAADLSDPTRRDRILEKLEIEMAYWERHQFDGLSVRWFLVTNEQIPDDLITNLHLLGAFKHLADPKLPSPADLAFIRRTCLEAASPDFPLSRLARQLDQQLRLPQGQAIDAIYHLIARLELPVDLFKPLRPDQPLVLLDVAVEAEHVFS